MAVIVIVFLNVFFLLAFLSPRTATLAASPLRILVYIDGELIHFQDQQPYIDSKNRTLVPVRFPAEYLGAEVSWDEAERQVTIEHEPTGRTIKLWLNSDEYTVNNITKQMDTVPVLTPPPARIMVPLRFMGEALDVDLTWRFSHEINTGFIFNFTDGQPTLEQLRMMDGIIKEKIESLSRPPIPSTIRPPSPIPERPPIPFPKRPSEQDTTEPAIPTPTRPTAPTPPTITR